MTDKLLRIIKKDKSFTEDKIKQVQEYLDGKRKEFDSIKINYGTDFQRQVWNEISKIPYGKTKTYKEIANIIGRPKAIRAVGTACGSNRFCIIIPCHRVVGSNGSLGGYAYGLDIKKELLELEKTNNK